MECTYSITMYVYCLSGFLPDVSVVLWFSQLFDNVLCMCIDYPVFGLVCCLSLCSCGTTLPSHGGIWINLTQKPASLCSSHESTPEGTQWLNCHGRHWWTPSATPPAECVDSPNLGPVHKQNTHEQLLSPPERRDLLLQLLTGVYRVKLIS